MKDSLYALILLILFSTHLHAQEISLTFDDAPTGDGPLFTGSVRSDKILEHLKAHGVERVAFFVLTGNLTSENQTRLTKYGQAGSCARQSFT